ncbi:MAG: hypothetical protein ABIA93_07855 [Candidatus Woesearchaeota archaeon]
MKWSLFFQRFALSLNPERHKELAEYPLKKAWEFFFQALFVGLLLSVILAVPALIMLPGTLEQKSSEFSKLGLDANVSATEPIMLVSHPRTYYLPRNTTASGTMLLTRDGIELQSYLLFGQSEQVMDWNDLKDIKSNPSTASVLLAVLAALMLPGLFVAAFVAFLVKDILLLFVALLIALVFFMRGKRKLNGKRAMQLALYSTTPLIVLDSVFLVYGRLFWISILVYVIWVILSFWLGASDKKDKKHAS